MTQATFKDLDFEPELTPYYILGLETKLQKRP